MFCTNPISIYRKGESPPLNPATGLPEWPLVACSKCKTCVAGRKNDWAGRLIAEARSAQNVYFLTLTYAREPEDYRYADVQAFLWTLRVRLQRKYPGTHVRFFCVGEKGNRFGRIHWHLLLFFDGPNPLPDLWNKHTNARELWEFWPHGWTDIAKVPDDDIVRRVRYCAKYAVKSLGQEDKSCRIRCSLKPAIGGKYLQEYAEDAAEAGLPLHGYFHLIGMRWEKGNRKGQAVKYRMMGASARRACFWYMKKWEQVRPSLPWPQTRFLGRYGRYYVEHGLPRWSPKEKCFVGPARNPAADEWITSWQRRLENWPDTAGPGLDRIPADQPGKLTVVPKNYALLGAYQVFWGIKTDEEQEADVQAAAAAKASRYPSDEEREQSAVVAFASRKDREASERRKLCEAANVDLSRPVYRDFVATGGFAWTPENLAEIRASGAFLSKGW